MHGWIRLTDVTLGSDAFFPFSDNIERAHKSGVKYIAQPGGSVRDDAVIETCNKYGMVMSIYWNQTCSITKIGGQHSCVVLNCTTLLC